MEPAALLGAAAEQHHLLFEHLSRSHKTVTLSQRLKRLHRTIRANFEFVERIAGALYDEETDVLKTFIYSTDETSPLRHYQLHLSQSPSLSRIREYAEPRVIDDLQTLANHDTEHTRKILAAGFRSSYTVPLYHARHFLGFVFFDSRRPGAFTPLVQNHLDLCSEMVALMIVNELQAILTLRGAVRAAESLAGFRDLETGNHQKRMAHYSRLIAQVLADRYGKNDDYVEHLFLFAPLHDIGKLAIPDRVLLKPGPLSAEEFALMRTHPAKGLEITDTLLRDVGLEDLPHIDVLRNLVRYHHEHWDGGGYPTGARGEAIPLEARIIAVADVFDALTSQRPYKQAWPLDATVAGLRALAGSQLDPACVEALIANLDAALEIMDRFRENGLG